MMRLWRLSWQSVLRLSQEHPPRFVESFMLFLASALLLVLALIWHSWQQWPYIVLSLSYSIGASISLVVREIWIESSSPRLTPVALIALLFLLILMSGLGYTVRHAIALHA
ncbi:hypothetical protein [Oscillatoria sp. FACHB-1406]|uniref:hypothetical protein n=1 Tax=Oscillatoria sp. FACHB-1406 TaxID=2692846 RepID=UPI001F550967|nr:hypothetical protein [Oscillatoria sp. FACHB-1406]